MSAATWRIKPDDHSPEFVDEVVMRDAYVHLEDLGDVYMLIVENTDQHIHLTIPHPRNKLAWVLEQYKPEVVVVEEYEVQSVVDQLIGDRA